MAIDGQARGSALHETTALLPSLRQLDNSEALLHKGLYVEMKPRSSRLDICFTPIATDLV
jgi:hypothetical protein